MSDPQVNAPAQAAEKRGAIRDRGYQRYTGGHTRESGRWRLIFSRMFRQSARSPWIIVMMILCVFPGLISAVAMYIQSKMHAVGIAGSPDPYVYKLFVKPYGTLLFAFLTALFAGGGAIADDAQAGAFPFYFARPVTRDQYLWGKLLPPVVLVAIVSTGPALLLALFRVALARESADALVALVLPLRTLAFGALEAAALVLPAVALSSLVRSRGYAQGLYTALFLLPTSMLSHLLRSPWPGVVSITANLENVGRFVFAIPLEPGDQALPVWVSAAALAVLVIGSFALLRRRIRRLEVVAG